MNDARLIERLTGTNAYRADAPLPDEIWSADTALQEIERRMHMQTDFGSAETPSQPTRQSRRKWLIAAVAGAAAVIIAVVIAAQFAGGDDEPDVASDAPAVEAAEWCRIGDEYAAAFESGEYGTNIALEDSFIAAAPPEIAAATRGLIESLSGGPSTWTGRDQWAEPIAEIEAFRGIHCASADMPGF